MVKINLPNEYHVKPFKKSLPIKWRKNAKNSYDGVSLNGKYDFNIRKEKWEEGYIWALDVFDHHIKKDHDKAHITSDDFPTLKEAKEEAEGWI